MKMLINNAMVVFPQETCRTSVLIEDGRIAAVDVPATLNVDQVVDAEGLHLLPGVIDDQVHFRQPGLTHKEDLAHASRACAAGGVTTYLEMPNTKPPAVTLAGVRQKEAIAARHSLVNYGFYIGATPHNLAELVKTDAVPGIKIFIGSSTGDLLVDNQDALESIFAHTKLPICAHCEDEATVRANAAKFAGITDVAIHSQVRSAEAAYICTERSVDLAMRHRHRFHVLHLSTAAELPLVVGRAPYITVEACPHHLFFNVDDYARLGSLIQMNPSIKTAADNQGLWQALLEGAIQVIATDHAPHTWQEKQQPYPASPSGLPAVENSLALMLDRCVAGKCSLQNIVSWMSDAPARVWGIVGKGRIEVGYDADLVLVDLKMERTIRNEAQYTKSAWSPWHGETLTGWPVMTWCGGRLVFNRGWFDLAARGTKPLFDHERGGFWATPDGIGVR
jgi:dihydroorotase